MKEREALVALNMMEGMGPITVTALVAGLGSAGAAFSASKSDLTAIQGVGPRAAEIVVAQRDSIEWGREFEEAEALGIRIVTRDEPEYPRMLHEIHDPPLVLYIRGGFESRDSKSIAVVGTRKPTYYGKDVAARFAGQIAEAGYTVVSGLAAGIDTIAHRQALTMKGRTIAVIGSGMKHLYPASNKGLADEIAGSGAVLSEFPLDRQPDKTTFPIRNRIVTGLSTGVLVVEAGIKSGAMITARMALEQGRSLFAVPGRIDSPLSGGTNGLIKQGAKLVENIGDILEEYEMLFPANESRPAGRQRVVMTDEERAVVGMLENGEMPVDLLIRETGMPAGSMSALLVGLEMKRAIRMLPGQLVALRSS